MKILDANKIDPDEFTEGFHMFMLTPEQGGYPDRKPCLGCHKFICDVKHYGSQCPMRQRGYFSRRSSYQREDSASGLDHQTLEESKAYRALMKKKAEEEKKVALMLIYYWYCKAYKLFNYLVIFSLSF